jgi:cardiolipin synthase
MNAPDHTPPRLDFAVAVEGPIVGQIVQTMRRVWALVQLVSFRRHVPTLFPVASRTRHIGNQTAKFVVRDNLRHRLDIERAYLAAIRTAKQDVLIANAYFLPGVRFRRALVNAARRGVRVRLLLQGRVEYRILHYASRALYGQLLSAGIEILEYRKSFMHAKAAAIDERWATVGSSNIDPFSFLLAREANIFVRDAGFAGDLRSTLEGWIADGSQRIVLDDWRNRSRLYKAIAWVAYGLTRLLRGINGYGSDDWWKAKRARRDD